MATITVVEGVGSHPGYPASSGGATGAALTTLDSGDSANSWSGKRGDRLFILNDAASSGDTITCTVEGQTNPYGNQSDKAVTSLDQGEFAIFDFDVLEGWTNNNGIIHLTIATSGTASPKGVVIREYQG
jgi:hypothetical protein